jgi:hypothetical protein
MVWILFSIESGIGTFKAFTAVCVRSKFKQHKTPMVYSVRLHLTACNISCCTLHYCCSATKLQCRYPVSNSASRFQLINSCNTIRFPCDKRVPITAAWSVLTLRMNERTSVWRVAANTLNNQSWPADRVWSSILGVGREANNSSRLKHIFVMKYSQTRPMTLTDTLVRTKQRKRNMRFGNWNVRILCWAVHLWQQSGN